MPDLRVQSIGRYQIIEKLGEGGMAIVYRALDTRLEREVAIKVIRTEMFGPAVLDLILKRFDREAKILAHMQHSHIVHVLDYGEFEKTPFLVMQYLPGGTLKTMTGKRMQYKEAARLLAPIAKALAYAHREGIIHRDVKPANILLTKTGIPMLTDFGIAKILETEQATQLTNTGMSIGTPEYMAPEQWTGNVSPQVDIYALGVLFYELITGRRPYTADTPAALMIQASTDPLPPPRKFIPSLPEEVEGTLLKALAKKPENRYASMAEFATILELLSKSDEPGQTLATMADARSEGASVATLFSKPAIPVSNFPSKIDRIPAPAISRQLGKPALKIPAWIWAAGGLGLIVAVAFMIFLVTLLVRNANNKNIAVAPLVTATITATHALSIAPTDTQWPENTATATHAPLRTVAPTPKPTLANTPMPAVVIYPINLENRRDYTSIWSMTVPDFVDMKSPGTQTYAADIDYLQKYRWEFAWCAVDNQTLDSILKPLSLNFIIDNSQPISDTKISQSHSKSYSGMECQYYDILLGDWIQGKQVKLDIQISLSEAINDGTSDYEAGLYHHIIFVNPK